ncbi:MAG TPA: hypothetical protein DDW27_04465 [Bacteroidales bacterium]|nr:hypothetical protein [Bacteroidales bacterium]
MLALFSMSLSCENAGSSKLPELETESITGVTSTSAISGGKIKLDGGSDIISKGVCWGIEAGPTIKDFHTEDGSGNGDFISTMTNLNPDTEYRVRAYAVNQEGIGYGDEKVLKTQSEIQGAQIIADHSVVDKYDDIPQYYIDQVKKMWLSYAGESHTNAIRTGMVLLKNLNPVYSVSQIASGTPEPYTTSNLRVNEATWGSYRSGPTGWVHFYGEQDWYTSSGAISQTKASLDYCATNGPALAAFGFGWCYDPDYMTSAAISDYLRATQEYVDHCATRGYPTRVFFTTGPVDDYSGLYGYNNHLRWKQIRDYVALDASRILFDYADILCWSNSGVQTTQTHNTYTYPAIVPENYVPTTYGHISDVGSIRLAKAMWWMLARIAGWNGQT